MPVVVHTVLGLFSALPLCHFATCHFTVFQVFRIYHSTERIHFFACLEMESNLTWEWCGRRHRTQHRARVRRSGQAAHLASLARSNIPCPSPARWPLSRAAAAPAVPACALTLVRSGAARLQRFSHPSWRARRRRLLMRWRIPLGSIARLVYFFRGCGVGSVCQLGASVALQPD